MLHKIMAMFSTFSIRTFIVLTFIPSCFLLLLLYVVVQIEYTNTNTTLKTIPLSYSALSKQFSSYSQQLHASFHTPIQTSTLTPIGHSLYFSQPYYNTIDSYNKISMLPNSTTQNLFTILHLTIFICLIFQIVFIYLFIIHPINDIHKKIYSIKRQSNIKKYTYSIYEIQKLIELIRSNSVERSLLYNIIVFLSIEKSTLQQLINIDYTTGLFNKRYFDTNILPTITKNITSILMIDIDYFKLYNDTFGHTAGDICLKAIASCIKRSVRKTDIVSRYGGEEFIIVLPHTTIQDACIVANRIHYNISTMVNSTIQVFQKLPITVSIGITQLFPTDKYTPKDVINTVDKALYLAKQNGRNQTVIYPNN